MGVFSALRQTLLDAQHYCSLVISAAVFQFVVQFSAPAMRRRERHAPHGSAGWSV
jgi:hypothetical protein